MKRCADQPTILKQKGHWHKSKESFSCFALLFRLVVNSEGKHIKGVSGCQTRSPELPSLFLLQPSGVSRQSNCRSFVIFLMQGQHKMSTLIFYFSSLKSNQIRSNQNKPKSFKAVVLCYVGKKMFRFSKVPFIWRYSFWVEGSPGTCEVLGSIPSALSTHSHTHTPIKWSHSILGLVRVNYIFLESSCSKDPGVSAWEWSNFSGMLLRQGLVPGVTVTWKRCPNAVIRFLLLLLSLWSLPWRWHLMPFIEEALVNLLFEPMSYLSSGSPSTVPVFPWCSIY